jgi:uncharacterized protein (TIGR02217 family)
VTLPTFPTLPGQGWSVKKTPVFSTRVANHVSGREVRAALYAHGLYQFELTFEGLDSAGYYPGLQANSLQTLMGFYIAVQGQFLPFLYVDPTDSVVSAQVFGQGDGVTTTFALTRTIGSAAEIVSYVTGVTAVTVAGTPTTAYTLVTPNTIVFATPPAGGAALLWSGSYGFQARFTDDTNEFENFMAGAWMVSSLKFRSIR